MKSLATGNVAETSGVEARAEQDRNKRVHTHWLMKSEPESRFEKGVDVKVSKPSSMGDVCISLSLLLFSLIVLCSNYTQQT